MAINSNKNSKQPPALDQNSCTAPHKRLSIHSSPLPLSSTLRFLFLLTVGRDSRSLSTTESLMVVPKYLCTSAATADDECERLQTFATSRVIGSGLTCSNCNVRAIDAIAVLSTLCSANVNGDQQWRMCHMCAQTSVSTSWAGKQKVCNVAFYCSAQCQTKHFAVHRSQHATAGVDAAK